MGRQLCYYMDYDGFLALAGAARRAGCLILPHVRAAAPPKPADDLSAVTPGCSRYVFYLPELAGLEYRTDQRGLFFLDTVSSPMALAVIEAGFSQKHPRPDAAGSFVSAARLYTASGYFDGGSQWQPRPARLTQVYDRLARLARKLAPATTLEADDIAYAPSGEAIPVKLQRRLYLSPACLAWRNEGYEFSGLLAAKERCAAYAKAAESRRAASPR